MEPSLFVKYLKDNEFGPIIGVPCSVFKDFLNYINIEKPLKHYISTSEGEAMGLAAGFSLSGKVPIVYMQNDGFGNAINPLTSLQLIYKLPTLLLISWRGEPGKKDAPQHFIMGKTLLDFLKILQIPFEIIDEANTPKTIRNAKQFIHKNQMPYALIFKKGYFNKYSYSLKETHHLEKRITYITELSKYLTENDIVLGTTGFTGRELINKVKHHGKFYMVGSMGCIGSIALGISHSNNDKNIFILDGDGALLMKMGTLSTIGYYKPNKLIHICFDNASYESTGGQKTLSDTVDFANIAKSCGYSQVFKIKTLDKFKKILQNIKNLEKPIFIHIKISQGTIENLPRPKYTPEEMKNLFVNFLRK